MGGVLHVAAALLIFNNMNWLSNTFDDISDWWSNGRAEAKQSNSVNFQRFADNIHDNGLVGGIFNDITSTLFGIDNDWSLNGIWNTITGKTARDEQNAYNDPKAQMARLTAAGINPNTASNQIANNNTSADNSSAPAAGLGALANAANTAITAGSVAELNKANAGKAIADTKTVDSSRDFIIEQIAALTGKTVEETRFLTEQINTYYSEAMARIANLNANSDVASKQVEVFNQQIENLKKEIDEMQSRITVNESVVDVNEVVALQTQYNNALLEFRKSFQDNYGFDPNNPLENAYLTLAFSKGIGSIETVNLQQAFKDWFTFEQQAIENRESAINQEQVDNTLKTLYPGMSDDERNQYFRDNKYLLPLVNALLGAAR